MPCYAAKLDRIWWIVTPGNPLKDHSELAPLAGRLEQCSAIARNPAFEITAFEARFNIRYTADTLAILVKRFPRIRCLDHGSGQSCRFSSLAERWRRMRIDYILVIDRPGSTLSVHPHPQRSCPLSNSRGGYRTDRQP
ncbi:MAG: hypothetical protein R3D29_13400 [Nitratireductor sp.]